MTSNHFESGTVHLSAAQVSKKFQGLPDPLFSAADLEVTGSSLVALLGSNGCGKSTLLSILAGVSPFDDGEIKVCGHLVDPRRPAFRRHLGYVPDEYPIPLKSSVREYLTLVCDLHGLDNKQDRVHEALAHWRLEEFARVHLEVCSHGVTKRVGLAAGMIHEPEFLLLDEPESGLDAFSFGAFTRRLEQHRDSGGSALIATHDLAWADLHCDRIFRFEDGRLVLLDRASPSSSAHPEPASTTAGLEQVTG